MQEHDRDSLIYIHILFNTDQDNVIQNFEKQNNKMTLCR